jgi:single-strand DNA-binding protein
MTHTITGKLNKDARTHQVQNGTTFFVDIGERNYNYKAKQNEYTNYSAAVFAKDGQVQYFTDSLIAGSVVSVTGTGLIIEMANDPQYPPRLALQDAKIVYCYVSGAQNQAPQNNSRSAPSPQVPQNDSFDDLEIPF